MGAFNYRFHFHEHPSVGVCAVNEGAVFVAYVNNRQLLYVYSHIKFARESCESTGYSVICLFSLVNHDMVDRQETTTITMRISCCCSIF